MASVTQALLLIAASAAAGAINSVAGGGTLVTFPVLVATGVPPLFANATNTVALAPASLTSLWGYRDELGHTARSILPLLVVGVAGGIAGAELLIWTPPSAFEAAAPFLVLTATLLFLSQERVSRWLKARAAAREVACAAGASVPLDREVTPLGASSEVSGVPGREGAVSDGSSHSEEPSETAPSARQDTASLPSTAPPRAEGATRSNGTLAPAGQAKEKVEALHLTPGVAAFLFGVAVYGGYFGAGIGILTLAALGLLGLTNLHQMNAIKNIFTFGVNGVAAVLFLAQGLVNWPLAGLMLLGSLAGGYAGAGTAKKIGQKNVRRLVIAIGFLSAAWLLLQLALGRR